MKLSKMLATLLALLSVFSCHNKKPGNAFDVFNEGVSLSLDAIDEENKGNNEKAVDLNRQSIEKFKETLQIDPTHPIARSAIGHGLYLNRQYSEAIQWFQQANKISSAEAA